MCLGDHNTKLMSRFVIVDIHWYYEWLCEDAALTATSDLWAKSLSYLFCSEFVLNGLKVDESVLEVYLIRE